MASAQAIDTVAAELKALETLDEFKKAISKFGKVETVFGDPEGLVLVCELFNEELDKSKDWNILVDEAINYNIKHASESLIISEMFIQNKMVPMEYLCLALMDYSYPEGGAIKDYYRGWRVSSMVIFKSNDRDLIKGHKGKGAIRYHPFTGESLEIGSIAYLKEMSGLKYGGWVHFDYGYGTNKSMSYWWYPINRFSMWGCTGRTKGVAGAVLKVGSDCGKHCPSPQHKHPFSLDGQAGVQTCSYICCPKGMDKFHASMYKMDSLWGWDSEVFKDNGPALSYFDAFGLIRSWTGERKSRVSKNNWRFLTRPTRAYFGLKEEETPREKEVEPVN